MIRPRLAAALALTVAIAPTSFLGAQPAEPAGPVDADLIEHVDVSLVNVDVVVVDKKGRPVEGLSADDFLVFEDGQPVAITNFYAARRETDAEPLSTVPVPEVAPDAADTPIDAPSPADAPALFVVYVDNLRLMPHRRNTFLEQVREVLTDTLRPRDRVMVITHRDGLRVTETFTSDLEAVGRALERIRESMGDGIRDRNERLAVLRRFRDDIELALQDPIEPNPCTIAFDQMVVTARNYADAVRGRAGRSLQGLGSLTSALAGVPGRKTILYLSNGIGTFPGLSMFHLLSEICPERATEALSQGQQVNLINQFHRLTSQANANRITFYAIDANGADTLSASDVRFEGAIPGNGRAYDVRPSALNDTVRRDNRQNSIFTLANETGGRLIANGNDVRLDLQAMTRDAQTYYALAFQPTRSHHDGRVHRIRVKLAKERKGVELRYRRTYLDKTADVRIAERTLAALRFGFEDNPLDIVVASGAAAVTDDGATTIPLRIDLALGSLVTVARDGYHEGRVHVVISAQDERNRPVEMRQRFIPIRITDDLVDEARDARHTFEVSVPVESGETVLAVAVRDTLATTTSYVQHRIHTGLVGDTR